MDKWKKIKKKWRWDVKIDKKENKKYFRENIIDKRIEREKEKRKNRKEIWNKRNIFGVV